jgi:Mg2+-importing ATPase
VGGTVSSGPDNEDLDVVRNAASTAPSSAGARHAGNSPYDVSPLSARAAASLPHDAVLAALGSGPGGLSAAEARARLEALGPNAVRTHHARWAAVLAHQFHSPLLGLLVVSAGVSYFVGERADAVIIAVIVGVSVGLGFVNEYRAERAAEALHGRLRHLAVVRRDGRWARVDVTELVPGDVVRLEMGAVVPADIRLLAATDLACDEAVLTGESEPVEKGPDPVPAGSPLPELRSCALMGTVVHAGSGEGVVVATGAATEFGRVALALGERQEETEFQAGLRQFSLLLARVAGVLTASIFATNLVLGRPVIDALLFSLAIAVGITPQLLPAVVTTSLATGARRMARRRVLVKRLVCIEDLGDVEVLLTDKTGTLTEGRVGFERAVDPTGAPSERALLLGLVCNEAVVEAGRAVGGNPLDVALWEAPGAADLPVADYARVGVVPFDHSRRRVSVLADGPEGRILVTKGAPEQVLERCRDVPAEAAAVLGRELGAARRVVAVAARSAAGTQRPTPADERDLDLVGFLVFTDPPKASAAEALARLAALGVRVCILTGDNATVAERVCDELGLDGGGTLEGAEIDALDDGELAARLAHTRVFARMDPEQKTRVVRLWRRTGRDVAYLGDGVNDAPALHAASVGISVEGATDVARDAADVVLLEKDLRVLADGVVEGRRIFANTVKYVLMGTSSNFGNMFSAAAASAFLPFLPMLPSQILLNNLLYDTSQLTIPTDRVDEEQLVRPSHWDVGTIRRFMLFFGPISSLFDFVTFAVLRGPFHAGPALFRSGWFVESLATQCLVILVIRTRRSPSWRSRPGRALALSAAGTVGVGAWLPFSPLARVLGFARPPAALVAAIAAMVGAYLGLVEVAKRAFQARPAPVPRPPRERRVHRRAARFSHPGPLRRARR